MDYITLNKNETMKVSTNNKVETLSLRAVDMNLLTVFDAVMQEKNITRAAHNLRMSQPAVSNAVSRLKTIFNDELFLRKGRGINPTQRACQLILPIRQALKLIYNELPSAVFKPEESTRLFKVAICNPCDIRFAANIMKNVEKQAPNVQLHIDSEFNGHLSEKMRYGDLDFVIDYNRFDDEGFFSTKISQDELVVITAKNHPRIQDTVSLEQLLGEKHAKLSNTYGQRGFLKQAYQELDVKTAYQGSSLDNLLYVVSQSDLVTIVPRWIIEHENNKEQFQILDVPFENKIINSYLSWYESTKKDQGHTWLRNQLTSLCI